MIKKGCRGPSGKMRRVASALNPSVVCKTRGIFSRDQRTGHEKKSFETCSKHSQKSHRKMMRWKKETLRMSFQKIGRTDVLPCYCLFTPNLRRPSLKSP